MLFIDSRQAKMFLKENNSTYINLEPSGEGKE